MKPPKRGGHPPVDLPEGVDLANVEPRRRADVALDHVHVHATEWERRNRRPRGLSAREALVALQFEALLVWTAEANRRNGVLLTDDDFARLTIAMGRIDAVVEEAVG